jgi:hypothetical protein
MSKRILAILTTMLFLMAMIPGLALAVDVTLDLSKYSARVGDEVTASGLADPNTWVSIKGLDNAQSIVYFDAVKSNAAGEYSNTFKIPNILPGTLTVVAGYGSNVDNKSLIISEGGSVTPATLSSISITKPANKLKYTVGDSLDLSGLEVTGHYSDGSSRVETITTANISGFDSSAPAEKQVLTITVGVKTASYEVSIVKSDKTGSPNGGGGPGGPTPDDTSKNVSASGGTVTGYGATVTIPANAVDKDIKVKVVRVSKVSDLPLPDKSKFIGNVVEVTKDKRGDFKKAVTITLAFEKSKVDADKYDLSLCYLDEKADKWLDLDNVKVDLKAGKVTGEISHFTKFAIIATEKPGVIDKEQPQPVEKDKKAIDLKDIQGHWAEKTIEELVASGAVSGYPDGTFQPNKTITRAEFSTILVKAFNLETKTGKVFNDTAGHWAKDNIATAQAHGIVSGYSDTTFGPNDNITREQMAVMIVKAAKLSESATGKTFADSSQISTWAQKAVATASENQIINGYPDNTFKPKASATRAEAATVIVKAL